MRQCVEVVKAIRLYLHFGHKGREVENNLSVPACLLSLGSRGFSLDRSNGLFQSLTLNFHFLRGEWRFKATQLGGLDGARTVVESPPRFGSVGIQSSYSSNDH